jgi:endonuclease/exonuclease/phosphatase family metal-dependent hydrolase
MKLRFGTFNLFQFVTPSFCFYEKSEKISVVEWESKTTWIKNQLLKMNCDVIGFQEVFSANELKSLVKEVGFDYFATADIAKTHPKDPTVFVSTLVAIASKYPIKELQEVKVHIPSLRKHDFKGFFKFSRKPIKAVIQLPNNKDIVCYVCHLKSNKENEFEYLFESHHDIKSKKVAIEETLKNNTSPSLKQRLCEAASLFHDIKVTKHMPKVLMCDLNDKEYSLSIDALFNKAYHYDTSNNQTLLKDAYYHFKPKAYNPHPEAKKPQRTSTSYFQGKGNVLDYVFVSSSFLKQGVHVYEVLNEHLQKHKDGSIRTSDHAQVVCEVTLS